MNPAFWTLFHHARDGEEGEGGMLASLLRRQKAQSMKTKMWVYDLFAQNLIGEQIRDSHIRAALLAGATRSDGTTIVIPFTVIDRIAVKKSLEWILWGFGQDGFVPVCDMHFTSQSDNQLVISLFSLPELEHAQRRMAG